MGPYLTRILRALVVTTLGVGGGSGLLVFIFVLLTRDFPDRFTFALQAGLIIGLIFSCVYVCAVSLLDLTARLFVTKGDYKDVWQLEQSREVTFHGNIKEAMAACRQALLVVPYVTAVHDDLEHLIVRATTGRSWRSVGEELEVELNVLEPNKWSVHCVSRPKAKDVVFDYAKNFENVEVWAKKFEDIKKGMTQSHS